MQLHTSQRASRLQHFRHLMKLNIIHNLKKKKTDSVFILTSHDQMYASFVQLVLSKFTSVLLPPFIFFFNQSFRPTPLAPPHVVDLHSPSSCQALDQQDIFFFENH
jgi:hypothetical protein